MLQTAISIIEVVHLFVYNYMYICIVSFVLVLRASLILYSVLTFPFSVIRSAYTR